MMGKALVLALGLAAGLTAPPETDPETSDNPILEACLSQGGDAAACGCLEREAGSRFSLNQRRVIAAAMPNMSRVGEPQDLVDALGFSLDQVLNLRQRVSSADPVFRQACGMGLDGQ
ncbi:hypothetical protein [Maricaulis parjimensis]|uniref:hypothetical protein n=1 Tax=Maricaulis parjimensis TaxID=144023 RepID=UPI001939C609|nr:hypothetical protein [Maricaulis parjimensis]